IFIGTSPQLRRSWTVLPPGGRAKGQLPKLGSVPPSVAIGAAQPFVGGRDLSSRQGHSSQCVESPLHQSARLSCRSWPEQTWVRCIESARLAVPHPRASRKNT